MGMVLQQSFYIRDVVKTENRINEGKVILGMWPQMWVGSKVLIGGTLFLLLSNKGGRVSKMTHSENTEAALWSIYQPMTSIVCFN